MEKFSYEKAAVIFKVLANPIRMKLIELLLVKGELSVSEIQKRLNIYTQSHISKNLARLKKFGFVTDRRDYINVYYSIKAANIGEIVSSYRNLAKVCYACNICRGFKVESEDVDLMDNADMTDIVENTEKLDDVGETNETDNADKTDETNETVGIDKTDEIKEIDEIDKADEINEPDKADNIMDEQNKALAEN